MIDPTFGLEGRIHLHIAIALKIKCKLNGGFAVTVIPIARHHNLGSNYILKSSDKSNLPQKLTITTHEDK